MPVAELLGSGSWVALEAMVAVTVRRHRPDLGIAVLDAADGPGFHQGWVQRRRAELAGQSGQVTPAASSGGR